MCLVHSLRAYCRFLALGHSSIGHHEQALTAAQQMLTLAQQIHKGLSSSSSSSSSSPSRPPQSSHTATQSLLSSSSSSSSSAITEREHELQAYYTLRQVSWLSVFCTQIHILTHTRVFMLTAQLFFLHRHPERDV